jgi:hypothetical protein
MRSAPLIITEQVTADLAALRDLAARHPVDIALVKHRLETGGEVRKAHLAHMQKQTYRIEGGPYEFWVTFSIETGHPVGACRHLSASVKREGRVPHPAAIELIGHLVGFTGSLDDWIAWPETLSDGATAINIVQPITADAHGHA